MTILTAGTTRSTANTAGDLSTTTFHTRQSRDVIFVEKQRERAHTSSLMVAGVYGREVTAWMSDGTERDDGLKNPMRFSIRNRRIDIKEKLRHPDFDEKQVTQIEIQDGQMYVHWEWSVATDNG